MAKAQSGSRRPHIVSEVLLIGFASVLGALGVHQGVNVATDHLGAPDWPAHAKFHAALGGAYMLFMGLLVVLLAWSRSLRYAGGGIPVAAVALALPLGFLCALAAVPAGAPAGSYFFLGVVGLVLAVAIAVLAIGGARVDKN